jgi:seryl-tRNA synthetase
MLDIKFIRENAEAVKKNCDSRNVKCDIDRLLSLDEKRKELMQQVEELNAGKNKLNDVIQKAEAEERKNLIEQGKAFKEKLEKAEPELKKINEEYKEILYKIPNVHSKDTPIGPDEASNKVIKKVGEPTKFDFQPKDHIQLGEELGIIDTERAAKISGSRFNYLKGELAILEFALVQYCFAVLTDETILRDLIKKNNLNVDLKAFIPIVPPVLIKRETLERMARLEPKEERYYIPSDDLYLIGSAEHSVGSIHMDEILSEKDLPLRYIGFSSSFRREAGSYGKDTKGILRVHQFDKLEMVSFSTPEQGLAEQNFIVAVQEYLIGSLELPYQVVAICTGDMGGPDYRQIDIETWLPGQSKYRETNTSDYNTDYQSRRLNTKVRRGDGKLELVHMNDATAFAIGRILIAILENYQQADGSVKIPEVLQKYMPGSIKEIRRK